MSHSKKVIRFYVFTNSDAIDQDQDPKICPNNYSIEQIQNKELVLQPNQFEADYQAYLTINLNIMQINNFFPEVEIDNQLLNEQILQLGLRVNAGQEEQLDRKQINILLNHILSYPSTQKAETHRDANRLGLLDFDKNEKYRRISELDPKTEEELNKICSCCGFILQQKQLSTCNHQIKEINNLGISSYVYFRTIVNVGILLAVMFVVYSIYSIITNIIASEMKIDGNVSKSVLDFLSISLGSKGLFSSQQKWNLYVIGAWIGSALLLIWAFGIFALRYYQKQDQIKILMETKTVSQYSLVIQKMPNGVTKQQVQQYFDDYLARLKRTQQINLSSLRVQKYNEGKPFYFNEQEFNSKELKQVMNINQCYKDFFVRLIKERRFRDTFNRSEKFRQRKYKQYQSALENKHRICEQILNKIKQQYKKRNKQSKTTAFITFATNHQKNLILDYNPRDFISLLKEYVPFLRSKNRFFIQKNGITYNLKIFPAPDPEDIVWSNIGVTSCEKITRKFLTFSITMVILAISFVIVYGLSTAQKDNQNNIYLSVLISLSISIINLIIIQVIQLLTKYERDYTMTNYQTSLAIKSIIAQILNTVFVPFVAAYFIKKNIYGRNGLIEDVFILAVTNSFVPPLVKLLDPYFYLRWIYSKYMRLPINKLQIHQFELNEICERLQFQVGYEYIYIVNLFIFTSYYVSLQPIIPLIAIIGLLSMYWAQKYSLFNRCQRPVPGTKILNATMSQMIYFGGVAYTLGSFTWANFLPENVKFRDTIPPNLVAASFAFLIFVFPYEAVFRKLFKDKRMPQLNYQADRIFFTSEYDRLNPSTSQSGIKEYRQFLDAKRKQLETERPEVKSKLSLQLQNNNRPNFFKQSNLFNTFKHDANDVIINNLISRQAQNILTPQMIANVLLPHNKMSLSRTNLGKRLPVPKLNKIRSTLPRRSLDLEVESINKNIKRSKETFIDGLQKAEIYNFENIHHDDRDENISQLKDSKVDKYLGHISQTNSYIVRSGDDSSRIAAKRPSKGAQIKLETSLQAIQKSKSRLSDKQNSNVMVGSLKKSQFRQGMIKEMGASLNYRQEIPNRFSINAENIIPLCVDNDDDINFAESLIKFYQLGDFQ